MASGKPGSQRVVKKSPSNNQEINLRIVLESPTAGVDYGIQNGHGSIYETIQTQRSTGADLVFEFGVALKSSSPVDFGGPIVQGPRGERFVYVDIGTLAGQQDTPWSRRLKIPLSGISSSLLGRTSSGKPILLETRVRGRGWDGSPACASVKEFEGWRAVK